MRHRQLKHEEVKKKFSNLSKERKALLVLVVNKVKDPRNLGALFRLADAAGIRHIYILGGPPESGYRLQRVARSANRHLQLHLLERKEDLMALKKDFTLVALEITSASIPYTEYRPERAVALIVGNEKNGIEEDILESADQVIHIPMYGEGSSMNVAMAAGIAIFGLLPSLPSTPPSTP